MPVRIDGIERTIQFVEEVGTSVVLGTAIEAASLMKELTPVLTGYAMNSWIVTPDKDDVGMVGANTDVVGTGLFAQFGLGQTIYINNGAEYIVPLEYGHSAQAPQGMVAVTLPVVPELAKDQLDDFLKARG